jgi:DNA-directed RNA polymerase subunit M/transcription elongation factor TFIIS
MNTIEEGKVKLSASLNFDNKVNIPQLSQDLESIFKRISVKDKGFTGEEVKEFDRIKWKNGKNVIGKKNHNIAYEIYCIAITAKFKAEERKGICDSYSGKSFSDVIKDLVTDFGRLEDTEENHEKSIFNITASSAEKEAYREENCRLSTKDKATPGIYQCINCQSYKTSTRFLQMRGGDEAETANNECFNCGLKWRDE